MRWLADTLVLANIVWPSSHADEQQAGHAPDLTHHMCTGLPSPSCNLVFPFPLTAAALGPACLTFHFMFKRSGTPGMTKTFLQRMRGKGEYEPSSLA